MLFRSRDALTRLIIGLHPLDGPRVIVRVDPAPGFVSMSNNDSIKHLNITIDVGRVKTRTRIPSPRRLFVKLKKSSFVKNQEDVLSMKLASLSPLPSPVFRLIVSPIVDSAEPVHPQTVAIL